MMKILTIGNSFTWSLRRYFPQVVQAAGETLKIEYMNFGGCELERHWGYIEAEKQNPVIRVYGGKRMDKTLADTAWDVVTIQQASHASWRQETFEPYAGKIVDFVRHYAPQAKIMAQQTWAYRADHPQFRAGSEWGITQSEMHRRLTENYTALTQRYGLEIIPTGNAVALTRENAPVRFQNYDPALLNTLCWPDVPPQAGDVVGNFLWHKGEDGELHLHSDLIHLNCRGEYLQACVWLAKVYGIDPETTAKYFVPEELGNADAAFLRQMAKRAVMR